MRGTVEYRSHLAEVGDRSCNFVYWEVTEMQISIVLNGKKIQEEIEPDLLYRFCKKAWM